MMWKELVQVANRRRFAVQKVALALGLCAIFFFVAAEFIFSRYGGAAAPYQRMAAFGRGFFWLSSGALAVVLSGAALIFGSGMVVSEFVGRRLPILLSTPLGSGAIISAKAVSIFSRTAAGLIVGLPVYGMLLFFGGVDWRMIVTTLAFIAVNVWLYGCIGLFFSVTKRKITGALSGAVAFALLWNLVPLFIGMYLDFIGIRFSQFHKAFSLSPLYVFAMMVESRIPAGFLYSHLVVTVALGAAFFALGMFLFRPLALRRLAGPPRVRRRFFKRNAAKTVPRRQRRASAISRGFGCGMIGKELLSWRPRKIFLSLAWFLILYAVAGLVGILSGERIDPFDRELHQVLFVIESFGFLLLLSVQAATRVAGEKGTRTLLPLVLTSLGRWRILFGKAAALLVEQAPAFLWLAAHVAFMTMIGFEDFNTFMLLPGLVLSPLFAMTLGFYFSVSARNVMSAVVWTGVTWFLGASSGVMLLFAAGEIYPRNMRGFRYFPVAILLLLSVVVGVVTLYRGLRRGYGAWLSAISYAAVSLLLTVLFTSAVGGFFPSLTRGRTLFDILEREEFVVSGFILPAGYLAALPDTRYSVLVGALVVMVQLCLLGWMFLTTLTSFEAQARRA